jgi:hypothetical protein
LVKLTVLPALATACATAPIREEDAEDFRINQAIRNELASNPSPEVIPGGIAYVDEDGPCPPDDENCVEEEEPAAPMIAPDVYVEGGAGFGGSYCPRHFHHHHVERGGFGGFFSSHPSGGFAHGGFHSGFAGGHAGFGAGHSFGGGHASMGG